MEISGLQSIILYEASNIINIADALILKHFNSQENL